MASLTSEQRQRIEQNRLRALQLRAQKDRKQVITSNSACAPAGSRVPQSFDKGTSNRVQQSECKQNTNKSVGVVGISSKAGQFKASSNISKASGSFLSATGPKNLSASHDSSIKVVTSTAEATSSTSSRVTPGTFSSSKPVSQFYKKTVSSGLSSEVNSKNETLKASTHFQKHNSNSDRSRNHHGAAVFSGQNVNATSSNFCFQKQAGSSISSKQSSTLMFGSKKSLSASCHLISKDRFMVEMPFQQNAVEIFQKMKSKCYDANDRKWSFSVSEYTDLVKELRSLQPAVDVKPLPPPVVKLFCTSSKPHPVQEANLTSVDQTLRDNLLPFQRDGVNFVIHHGGRALIADDMGLGKTIQAICVACYYRTEWPILIVSPSSMRYSWAEAFQKWVPSLDPDDIHVIATGQKEMGLVNIISYDLMARMAQQLAAKRFQIVIMDESHFLKNYKTARTKAAVPILKNAPRRLLLSGTPALSRPSELYMQIQVLHSSMFPSFHEFGIRYCDAKQNPWGWDYSGSSNLTELQLLLERKIMIRRLKSDVLSQLPSKTRQKVIMDPKTIKTKSSSFKSLAAAARKETANREMILEYYAETARMKMSAVRAYVEDLLEGDKKFLVFAHHQNMMETLCEACQSKKVQFIRIDGSTPPQQRFKFCEDFQTKDECRVAVLSIMAANSGITLTAASLVVFAELFWNPGILMQAEDRAHRIGQNDAVFIHYLIAKGTADDHLWPLVQRKLRILEKAGLSKNDFSEADTKVMKDPRQQSILNFLEQSFAEEFTQEELQALEDAADVSSAGETWDSKDEKEQSEESGSRSVKGSCTTLNSLWSTTNKETVTPPMKKLKVAPSR